MGKISYPGERGLPATERAARDAARKADERPQTDRKSYSISEEEFRERVATHVRENPRKEITKQALSEPEPEQQNGHAVTISEEPRPLSDEAQAVEDLLPPVIDEGAYHGLAGDTVRALEPHTEADSAGLLIQLLTVFGNLVGNSPYYQVESDRHRANLFTVQVGKSAKGRKGTAGARVRAITQDADELWAAERNASGLSSGEGLINAVRDPVTKWDVKEKCEEVIDPGIQDKRLMVTEPGVAGALAVMERHGNTLSPVIRNAWDGQRLQTLTKSSPLKATGAHISIVAHITEAEVRARPTRTDIANGFANRFLFCLVRRSKLLPFGGHVDDAVMQKLAARLAKAVEFAKGVGRVRMSDAAARAWAEFHTRNYPPSGLDCLGQ